MKKVVVLAILDQDEERRLFDPELTGGLIHCEVLCTTPGALALTLSDLRPMRDALWIKLEEFGIISKPNETPA